MITKMAKQQTMHSTLMKKRKMIWWSTSALVGACLISLGLILAQAEPPKTDSAPSPTNSVAMQVPAPDTKPAVVKQQLTGAELYSMHCNRCHQERYPTERTAAQWKTIMLHMQVRANLPVKQANLILQYLQENSGR
jgi:cytochrome c5